MPPDAPTLWRRHSSALKVLRRWDVDRGDAPSRWQCIEWAYGPVERNQELTEKFDEFRASLGSYFT
jgi:hypothetical protein